MYFYCILAFIALSNAATLLYDDFNTALDTSKWDIDQSCTLNANSAAVVVQGGRVEITNRGYLISKGQWDPTTGCHIRIEGQWTFAVGLYDHFGLVWRSNVSDLGTQFCDPTDGLSWFYYQGPISNLDAAPSTAFTFSESTPQSLTTALFDTINFNFTDAGTIVSGSVSKDSDSSSVDLTNIVGSSLQNKVAFFNREYTTGVGEGTHTSFLEWVRISTLSDPVFTGAVSVTSVGLVATFQATTASFTNSLPPQVTIYWGDETSTQLTVTSAGGNSWTVPQATHTYSAAQSAQVVVEISDYCGLSYNQNFQLTLAELTTSPFTTSPITSAEMTSSPLTSAEMTSSPLTTSPLTSAEMTSSPLTSAEMTSSPLTTSPVTSSPLTTAEVTSSPLTTSPVTSSPLTTSPVTSSPLTSADVTSGDFFTTSQATTDEAPITSSPVTSAELTSAAVTSGVHVTTSPLTTSPVTSAPVTSGVHFTTSPLTTGNLDCGSRNGCGDCKRDSLCGFCAASTEDQVNGTCYPAQSSFVTQCISEGGEWLTSCPASTTAEVTSAVVRTTGYFTTGAEPASASQEDRTGFIIGVAVGVPAGVVVIVVVAIAAFLITRNKRRGEREDIEMKTRSSAALTKKQQESDSLEDAEESEEEEDEVEEESGEEEEESEEEDEEEEEEEEEEESEEESEEEDESEEESESSQEAPKKKK